MWVDSHPRSSQLGEFSSSDPPALLRRRAVNLNLGIERFFWVFFFWVWETETVKEAVMPFKWLIFWYLGLVNVNAEIHSDLPELLRTIPFVQPIRCIRAAMYYSICSANGRDESFWMIGAIIHPYFRKKVQRQISWKLEFFLGGFWSRFIIYIYIYI